MNELHAAAFICFISLLATLYFLICSYLNNREIKRLREIRYISETQKNFGIARHRLFELLQSEELSDESITFLHFYLLNTLVMRNPDKHKILAAMMRKAYFKDDDEKSAVALELEKESKDWSPAVREMVILNIQAMNSLMVLHSSLLRIVVGCARVLLPIARFIIHNEIKLFSATSKLVAKRDSAMKSFVKSKEELLQLAYA